MAKLNRRKVRQRVHHRIRRKIAGTAEKPRLAVNFSNQNVYAQLIDDEAGVTLVSASTLDKSVEKGRANQEGAKKVGELIASRAKEKNIESVVFDRGGFLFHGKVKALAEGARDSGLQF